ncbi:MAG TPA: GAF domain-containing protein [Actinomycetes bacterium]|nr:GAF domain-containing protein [Actinomycetes bacterium]
MAVQAPLSSVAEVAGDIVRHLDLESTLLSIQNAALDLLGADIVGILLVDEEGGEVLRMRACAGHRTVHTAHLEVRRDQGVAGKVFETGRPYRVDDYPSDTSISRHFSSIAEQEGKRSALGAPMTVGGKVIGTLMVWSRRPSAFTQAHTDTLVNLANLATIALENARLYETERQAARTLAEANQKLEEQYELLQRASNVHEELTHLVLEGGTLGDLVQMLARHTGGTAAILGPGLEILATSPDAEQLADRARRHLRAARERHRAAPGTSPVPPDAVFGHWLLVRDVVAGGERLAGLCVGLPQPPRSLDTLVLEQAAIVCALELTKQRAVLEARVRVRSDFLWDLLDGNIGDDAEALMRAHHLGYSLPQRLRVMLAPVRGLDDWARATEASADAVDRRQESLVRAAERLATAAGHGCAFAARRGSLIALLLPWSPGAPEAGRLAEDVLEGLEEANPDLSFSAGLSASVPLGANLHPAYLQAQHALSAIPVLASGRRVFVFDDLGVLQFLLAPADRAGLTGFARKVLGPVIDYDRDHHADLVRTVEVYLASDCNLQRTAKKLFVHPKTVRYRLGRVEELAAISLGSQQDRFDAQMAVRIVRVLSLGDGDGPTAGAAPAAPR